MVGIGPSLRGWQAQSNGYSLSLESITITRVCHARCRREAGSEEPAMTEKNLPAVAVTEVVLPGKVEPSGLRLAQRELPPPAAGPAPGRVASTALAFPQSALGRGRD